MKTVIRLDVPDWQVGNDVTVIFPDTMLKTGVCEKDDDSIAYKPFINNAGQVCCGKCRIALPTINVSVGNRTVTKRCKYCCVCGSKVGWES